MTIKSTTIHDIKINLLLSYKYSQFYDQTEKNSPRALINRKLRDTMDNILDRQNNMSVTQTFLNRPDARIQGIHLKMIKNRDFFLLRNTNFFKKLKV